MANIAACAVAIAMDDLKKLKGAIKRTPHPNGYHYESVTVTIGENGERYRLKRSDDRYTLIELKETTEEVAGGLAKLTTTKEGKTILKDVTGEEWWEYKKSHGLMEDYAQFKVLADIVYDNGWELDWKKLHAYSYQGYTSISKNTFGDTDDNYIKVEFDGRWDFPIELEDYLNDTEVRWQGVACDPAMEYEADFGNTDFGLDIYYDVYCAECDDQLAEGITREQKNTETYKCEKHPDGGVFYEPVV